MDPVYKDFLLLKHASKIVMVPKFSSFAAVASMLGKNVLYSFFPENATNLYRYHCDVLQTNVLVTR